MFQEFVSPWMPAPARLAPGVTACAVGDVHGCVDHLVAMVRFLDQAVYPVAAHNHLVLIGDYVDRGPASLATLRFLQGLRLRDVAVTTLLGNHDFFLALIVGDGEIDMAFVEAWFDVGGATTLAEMGISREDLARLTLDEVRETARRALGADVVAFLASLARHERLGGYLFVHAGLDPALALEAHDVSDLVMMREPFLSATRWTHDCVVVHGHTIRGHETARHRIAIDTGAFRTGILSAVHLVEDRMRWIAVTEQADLAALDRLPCVSARPSYAAPVAIRL